MMTKKINASTFHIMSKTDMRI